MLHRFSISKLCVVLGAALGVCLTGIAGFSGHSGLFAANVSWDAAGGGLLGTSGTWGTASNWWTGGPSDVTWNNANNDTAVFAGTVGTVTLGGSQNAGGLTFSSTGGYTLTGNTLNLAGAAPLISLTTTTTNTISSILTGSGNITIQAGTGTVVFTASNAYTGHTIINSGVLSLASSNGSNLAITPGTVAVPNAVTLNGGTLRFTALSTYNTGLSLGSTAAGITLGASGGTVNVATLSTGTFATNEPSVQIRGIISGSGNLTVTGGSGTNSGTTPYLFELGAQNTYTGATTVSNAIICYFNNGGTGPNNILPTTTVLNLINNGWFNFNNNGVSQQVAGLSGDSTGRVSITNGSSAGALTVDPAAGQSYTFAGSMGTQTILGKGGTGAAQMTLTINGPGTEIFTGASIYTGATTLSAGTLQLGNATTTGGLSAGSTITDNAMLVFDRSNTVVQGTDFSTAAITGNGGLAQIGSGILRLNAANTFSGGTNISSGTIQLANVNALQNSTVAVNAPINSLSFTTTGTFNLGGLTGNGAFAISNTAGAAVKLSVGANNASTLFSGNLSGGSLTKVGNGTLFLSGVNTYNGATAVSAGTLEALTPASLSNYSTGGSISVANGALLAVQILAGSAVNGWTDANISSLEGNSNLTFAASGALGIDVVGGATYTRTADFAFGAGTNNITKLGTGTLIVASSNSYSGATTISAGTLQIGNGGSGLAAGSLSTSSAITNNGMLAFNRSDTVTQGTDFGAISGSGTLSQAGSGTLLLIGTMAFSGVTTVNNGTLDLQNQLALQNCIFAGGSGMLVLDSSVGANAFTFGGLSGSTNLQLVNSASNAIALSVGNSSQNSTYTGVLSGGGSLIKIGSSSTQVIGGGNTYTGTTTISAGTLQIGNNGNLSSIAAGSTIIDNATLAFAASNALTEGVNFSAALISGSGGFAQSGGGTLTLNTAQNYTGPTSATSGLLILQGVNSATGGVGSYSNTPQGLTVVSVRSSTALGSGTANSSLSPISMNAIGGNNANSITDTAILEIGATIGADPGGHNADFSYQVVAPLLNNAVVPGSGQISLGSLGNNDDGVGFAALTATTTSAPRVVALYTPNTTTLAVLQEKTQFGQGTGDHLTLGSPTSNNTLILLNTVDLNGGASRQFASIRGVGIVPEGEYAGPIIDATTGLNVSFNGNGGLIFESAATSYQTNTLQINGGAVFVAAFDPASGTTQTGALGSNSATMQVGTGVAVNPAGGGTASITTAGANVAFMTYGPNTNGINQAIQTTPIIVTNRNIAVGGSGVVYNSATLGGMTDDYTAMNGNIALNQNPATPTTFFARNGGRVDFGGVISGSGSVVVGGNSVFVEGDASAAGIALNNNGSIVFGGTDTYTGVTTVSTGKLYVNGVFGSASSASLAISSSSISSISVASGASLGGTGTVTGAVTVLSGGILEGGLSGTGALTLANSAAGGGLTFSGPASVYFGGLNAVGNPSIVINGANTLNTNGNTVTLSIGAIPGTGDYALIGYNNIQTSSSNTFTLPATLPNRAVGTLAFNNGPNELDLDITSLASIVWTGATNTRWDTATTNWVQQGAGATQYIDNPGDTVIFDDSAGTKTNVSINSGDVHPGSVTFNNTSSTYTISGSNAIAGGTILQLTGAGTVVLTNSNTYTGATTIGGGATLKLGNGLPGNDGSISSSVGITDNGSLIYNLAGAQAYGGAIGGAGSLALQNGALTLTGSSNYSGGTTVSAGTLQLGVGAVNQDGSLAGNLTNNSALIFNYFATQTFAGAISGSGSVAKTGNGTVVLGGSNTFTGGLALNFGGVQLANAAAVQNSTVTMATNSSLTFAAGIGSFGVGGLTGNAPILLQDTAVQPVALSVGSNGQNTTFSGILSGSGSLTKAGTGLLTLTASNTYLGGTNINAGTLNAGSALAIGSVGSIGFGGGTLQFSAASAGLDLSPRIAAGTSTGPVSIDTNGQNTTFFTGLTANQSGGLTKLGAGTLALNAANNYSGNTLIGGGVLLVNGPLNPNSAITVSAAATLGGNGSAGSAAVQSGGIIDVSANYGTTLSLTGLALGQISGDTAKMNFSPGNPNVPQLVIGGAGLSANGGNSSVTVNFGGSGALVGTYTLATYSGGTGPSAFVLGSTSGLTSHESGALLVTGGSIDFVVTGYYPIWTGANSGQWVGNSNWKRSDNGGVIDFLPGDGVVFDDSGPMAGGTPSVTINSGDVSPGSVTFNNNNFPYTVSGANGIAGPGILAINGSGSVTLSTSNTYSGGTYINAGVLIASNSSGVATGSGPMYINGGTLQVGNGGATGTLGGSPISDNTVLAFARSDSGLVVANTISGSGTVVQLGPGMTTLTANNYYNGGTVVNGGVLSIASSLNLGTAVGAAAITLNGGTLQITANTPFDRPTIDANSGITLGAAGGAFNVTSTASGTFGTTETAVSYRGLIAGAGNLTVIGGSLTNSGTTPYLFELGAQNTYGGTTTVNNATLCWITGTTANGFPTTGPVNILPTTTVLNLVNNGWFNFNNGAAAQSVAGLTGDATGKVSTTNGGNPGALTITPSAGAAYNFPGVIGAQTILGKTGTNSEMPLVINGAGGLQILSGPNTYQGATTITAGTLQIGGGGVLGGGSYTGAIIDNDNLVFSSSSNQTFSGAITGNGNLTMLPGARLLVLTNAATTAIDTISGATTVSAGTLELLATAITTGSGALPYSPISVAPGAVLVSAANDQLGSITNNLSISVSGELLKSNNQSETLFRPITLSGGTMMSSPAVNFNNGNGAWDFFGGSITTAASTANSISGTGAFSLRTNTVFFDTLSGSTLTISSPIIQNTNSANTPLNLIGSGTVILTASNSYPGGTNVGGGTLAITGSGNLGATSGNLAIVNSATLDLGGTTQSVGTVGTTGTGVAGTIQNGKLNIQNNNMYFQSGALTANVTSGTDGRLYIGGNTSATVLLGGNNTIANASGVSTVIGSGAMAAGTVQLITPTGLGPISQGAQVGSGTLDLNGQTNVTVGEVVLMSSTASFLVNNNVSTPASFNNTVDMNGGVGQIGGAGSLTLGGRLQNGGLNVIGSGVLIIAGSSNTYTGPTTVSAGTLQIGTGTVGQDGSLATSGITNNSALVYNLAGNQTALYGISGPGNLAKLGAGTLILANSNTYTGPTTISAGTLQLGTGVAGQDGSLTTSGITNNSALVYNLAGNQTVSYAINGPGSLSQVGNGSLVLNTVQSYSGPTYVNAGSLVIDASPGHSGQLASTSGVSVAGGATLQVKGSASIAGGLTSSTNGAVSLVDNSINTLTVGGPISFTRSSLDLELGSTGMTGMADELTTTGPASLTGVSSINIGEVAGQLILSGSYTLVSAASGLGGGGSARFQLGTTPVGFYQFNLVNTATAVTLVVSGNSPPVNAYWTGLASSNVNNPDPFNQWSWGSGSLPLQSNWSTDANGSNDALQVPGPISNVFFTAANATPNNGTVLSTQLDGNYNILSLTFDTSAATNAISAVQLDTNGNALTIGAGGLTLGVHANTSASIIDSTATTGAILVNGSQPWANNSNSQSLTVAVGVSAVSGATTLTLNGAGTGGVTLSGVLADGGGTLSLSDNQAGVTVLSGANTYSGGTTIGAGTLNINSDAALGAAPAATTTNVTFTGNSTLQFAAPASLAATRGVSIGGGVTATMDTQGNIVSIAGPISGGGNLAQVGPGGTLILTNSETYSGSTTISAGTLQLGTGASGQDGSLTTSGITDNSAIVYKLFGAQTAGYGIGGGGSLRLSSGTLVLAGVNSYAGGTTVNSGVLEAITTAALPSYSTGTLSVAGGAELAVQVQTANSPSGWTDANITALVGNANVAFAAGSTLGIDVAGATYTSGINLTANAGGTNNLVEFGGGALILTVPNTFTGTTTISNGTLQLGNGVAGHDGSLASPSIIDSGNLVYDLVSAQTYGGTISGPGGVTVNASSGLTLGGSNTFGGGTTLNGGVLRIGNSGALSTGPLNLNGGVLSSADTTAYTLSNALTIAGSVTFGDPVNNGALTFSAASGTLVGNSAVTVNSPVTITSALRGVGASLTVAGQSILTLSGSNTFDSGTYLNSGVLSIANSSSLGTANGPAAITFNGGTLQITAVSAYGVPTIDAAAGITLGASGGTINVPVLSTGTFAGSETAVQYKGFITGTGNLTVTGGTAVNSGAAPYIFELGAQNTYAGTTTVNNAILAFESNNNGGVGPVNILPPTTVLNLINNGWFNLNNGVAAQTIAGLNGDATGKVSITNGTSVSSLTITPSAGQTYVFAGDIGAQTILGKAGGDRVLALLINGPGTQVLSGANTYSGSSVTTISGSAVTAGTTIAEGTLQLGNGGATGSIAFSTVNDNGVLAVDRSDTVNLSSLILTASTGVLLTGDGGLLQDGPGTLVLGGTSDYTGGTTVTDGELVLGSATAIETGSSLFVGNPAVVGPLALGAVGSAASPAASSGATAAVPEPSTLGLLIAAACGLAACLRRRKARIAKG